jgi:ketosteroid isomerase-like protein
MRNVGVVADATGFAEAAEPLRREVLAHCYRMLGPDPDRMSEPGDPATRLMALRYAEAFERADLDALAALLRDDVVLEMPPHATWFAGREPVAGFLGTRVLREPGTFVMRHVYPPANGQLTFAMYAREPDGSYRAHALHVVEADGDRVGCGPRSAFRSPRAPTWSSWAAPPSCAVRRSAVVTRVPRPRFA